MGMACAWVDGSASCQAAVSGTYSWLGWFTSKGMAPTTTGFSIPAFRARSKAALTCCCSGLSAASPLMAGTVMVSRTPWACSSRLPLEKMNSARTGMACVLDVEVVME